MICNGGAVIRGFQNTDFKALNIAWKTIEMTENRCTTEGSHPVNELEV